MAGGDKAKTARPGANVHALELDVYGNTARDVLRRADEAAREYAGDLAYAIERIDAEPAAYASATGQPVSYRAAVKVLVGNP